MIIVYACFSGTHAAVIAGAMHLGLLKPESMPTWEELQKLPNFDATPGKGGLRFLGRTQAGYAVYSAEVGNDGQAAWCAVKTVLPALGYDVNEVLWIDVSGQISFLWRLGAILRWYSLLARLGHLLLRWSLRRDYWTLGCLVKGVIKELKPNSCLNSTFPM